MADDILQLIVELEYTLGDFYGKAKNLTRFMQAKPVLSYMEEHSLVHGQIIEEAIKNLKKPQISKDLIKNYQNNLTKKIFTHIKKEEDIRRILKTLADSEVALGKLYESIADYLDKRSAYYGELAEKVKTLAGEEFQHGKLLMMDKKRIEEKTEENE